MTTPSRKTLLAAAVLCGLLPSFALAETVLVSAGTAMTYRANSANPGIGTAWTAEVFTPSGWSAGSYGVGYEQTAPGAAALLATAVPLATNSVYSRTTFTIADVAAVNNLFLGADYDDGYIAWINGVEVFRSAQMPAGAPAWNTAAASHESSNGAGPNYGTLQNISAAALGAIHNGTNVLAIGVWNTTLPSSDLVLVPRLSINRDAEVTRGPYLQMGTPTSVTVRWRTSTPGDSCVDYGAAPGSLTLSSCSGASTTEHEIDVTGLTPDTTYYYSVGTSTAVLAGNTSDHFFVTSPPTGTGKPTRVWALGDSGTADANQAAVRDAYLGFTGSTPTDLWLMLGDNAYNSGTDSEFEAAVFDMYPTTLRNSVLWPTLGNHDGTSADSATQTGPYYNSFTLPTAGEAGGVASGTEAYYSFDYGDIHFICLESYETSRAAGGAMMTWLAADLADTTAEWIVAFFHHPPYTKGSHNSDTETELIEMRQNALPILEQNGVDLVLTGHSHSYERSYLLDGHYGLSSTFSPTMQIDGGNGREDGTGAYQKDGGGPVSHQGAVYVVAGSSGKVQAATLNHPAMYVSMSVLGSLVLDFNGNYLDVRFLDNLGVTRDYFTMVKAPPGGVCGNGIPEAGEDCDDGNAVNTDACLTTCVNATCGDGFVRAGVEQCDGAGLGGATCASRGFAGGTLSCSAACTFDTAQCTTCGNNVIDAGELCDGTDLGGGTCALQGCTGGGALACDPTCSAYDKGGCAGCAACNGNGTCDAGEDCNGCPADCVGGSTTGAVCGNGTCEAGNGEDCLSCPSDCNGVQGGKPQNRYCCGDGSGVGPVACTDSRCTASGRTCTTVPSAPTSYCCGNDTCEASEGCSNCATDCAGPSETCGNGIDDNCNGTIDCTDSACSSLPACQCAASNSSCTSNSQCCSGSCRTKGKNANTCS